jgi:predicted transposase/invertase (TIGR01784 family)
MNELSNPHDRFFKEVFSRPEVARDFLENYLPAAVVAQLDLATLALRKDSFIDPDLQQHYSDLLYQVDLQGGAEAFVYVLFEHKSYPEPMVAFQLLRYLVRIWEQALRQQGQLAPIIPLVVYHGRSRWQVALNFDALFSGPEALRPYWPGFDYQLCDVSLHRKAEIQGAVISQVALLLLRHIFDPKMAERLPQILALLHELADKQTALQYLETTLRYVSQAAVTVSEDELRQAMTTAFSEDGGALMATIAEKWFEQGLEQGLERSIIQVLERRFGRVPAENIKARLSKLPVPTLEMLLDEALVAADLETFEQKLTAVFPDSTA